MRKKKPNAEISYGPIRTNSMLHKTSYSEIVQSLEGVRSGVKIFLSYWNLAGASAAVLLRYLLNFRPIKNSNHQSRNFKTLQDFSIRRLMSYAILNRPVTSCEYQSLQIAGLNWCVTLNTNLMSSKLCNILEISCLITYWNSPQKVVRSYGFSYTYMIKSSHWNGNHLLNI